MCCNMSYLINIFQINRLHKEIFIDSGTHEEICIDLIFILEISIYHVDEKTSCII